MLKARRRRSKLSMTSLIDVIFLLLLFFMLTSTFTKFSEVELIAAPQGSGGGTANDVPPLFIKVGPDSLTLNAAQSSLDVLPEAIADLRRTETGQQVLMSLEQATDAQRLTDVLLILRSVQGLQLRVLGAGA